MGVVPECTDLVLRNTIRFEDNGSMIFFREEDNGYANLRQPQTGTMKDEALRIFQIIDDLGA